MYAYHRGKENSLIKERTYKKKKILQMDLASKNTLYKFILFCLINKFINLFRSTEITISTLHKKYDKNIGGVRKILSNNEEYRLVGDIADPYINIETYHYHVELQDLYVS